jgi:hypothetical protein
VINVVLVADIHGLDAIVVHQPHFFDKRCGEKMPLFQKIPNLSKKADGTVVIIGSLAL